MKNKKHLALNVPVNFLEHVEFARSKQFMESIPYRDLRNSDQEEYLLKRYHRCFEHIFIDYDENKNAYELGRMLKEVEVRFIALHMTIDQSVPVKPLYEKYRQIGRNVLRKRTHIPSDERDDLLRTYTLETLGCETIDDLPTTIDDFRNAKTLAEKALIAEVLTIQYGEQIQEIASHFDYKREAFGRGSRPTYGLVYLVMSLANIFQKLTDKGTLPIVNINEAPSPNNSSPTSSDLLFHYTGDFLHFVTTFVFVVEPGLIGSRASGFYDRVRKITQRRKVDPALPDLLHKEEVTVEGFLEFMSRADVIKNG